jgi:hypothetical protein
MPPPACAACIWGFVRVGHLELWQIVRCVCFGLAWHCAHTMHCGGRGNILVCVFCVSDGSAALLSAVHQMQYGKDCVHAAVAGLLRLNPTGWDLR